MFSHDQLDKTFDGQVSVNALRIRLPYTCFAERALFSITFISWNFILSGVNLTGNYRVLAREALCSLAFMLFMDALFLSISGFHRHTIK